jgi:hypothetical protein
MKRFAFVFTLVGATALAAAPLAAQTRNDGPWWDPGNTGTRTTSGDNRGTIYDGRNGTIYGSRDDGQWKQKGRDSRGNYIYVRRRHDRSGNLIEDRARRDTRGQFHIIDSRVIRRANSNDRRIYDNRGVYDRNDRDGDRNNDGYIDQKAKNNKNDRWAQNNGHDNGKHNGQYKNKSKGKR